MLPYHGQIDGSRHERRSCDWLWPSFCYRLPYRPMPVSSLSVRILCSVQALIHGYHPVPPKAVSALLPPVPIGVADNAASADLNVKGMMCMTTDPYIRGLFGMQDVIESLCATGKQKICLLPRISRRRAIGMRHVMGQYHSGAVKWFCQLLSDVSCI